MLQIKLFSKDELAFESNVNEFLKQLHETPTMSLIEVRTLDSYIAIVYDLREHKKTSWLTSSVLYAELQKNICVYLKAIQCATHVWTSFKKRGKSNKSGPMPKPKLSLIINMVYKKRAKATNNNYARTGRQVSIFNNLMCINS